MPKEQLKRRLAELNNNQDTITGEELPDETRLFDTHRSVPKRKGGRYTDKNTGVVIPITHMIEHSTLRIREAGLDKLKTMMDDRRQIMKGVTKINNQLLAYERRVDNPNVQTTGLLEGYVKILTAELKEKEKEILEYMKAIVKENPLAKAAIGVRSVGPITIASCLIYIDLHKADHASSLWKYAGLHAPSHSRYVANEASGGNKTLRTALYAMAESQMKGNGAYRSVYDSVKLRLEHSDRIVKSRTTAGDIVEVRWKDTMPCHRHGAALRAVMKHFLADYWMVGRTLLGLPTSPLYPEAVLGKGHRTVDPKSRGWKY